MWGGPSVPTLLSGNWIVDEFALVYDVFTLMVFLIGELEEVAAVQGYLYYV